MRVLEMIRRYPFVFHSRTFSSHFTDWSARDLNLMSDYIGNNSSINHFSSKGHNNLILYYLKV